MTDPLVSVVLPVHNRAAFIARAVTSVLDQTYTPLELIVVDDGSTDETARVLTRWASRLTVVSQARAGAYAARNAGLARARGDFVAFIDSDDVWLPERLARQMPLMARPEVGLVFGDAHHVRLDEPRVAVAAAAADHRDQDVRVRRTGRTCFQVTPPQRGRVAAHFAWGNFVPTTTVLVRRRCLEEVGGFAVTSALSVDYLTWFRIARRHAFDYVEAPAVAEYTIHADGISQDLGQSLRARIQLFSDELARTTDADTRETLHRLLFNLALHLGLASVRGRARGVPHAPRLAWDTARAVVGREAAPWAAAFAWHQVRRRRTR